MSSTTLRFIRFFAPAVILVVLTYAILKMVNVRTDDMPISVNDLGYNLSYLIIAAIYQYLPLRDAAYRPFITWIDGQIRSEMVKISALPDDTDRFSWENVKNVYYWLIDNDESLKVRADDVRFNGAMMTTFADLTIISALFLICCLIALSWGVGAERPTLLLAIVMVVSLAMQFVAAWRHFGLAKRQLRYIEQIKKTELIGAMQKIDA